jgi:hypothetical protein
MNYRRHQYSEEGRAFGFPALPALAERVLKFLGDGASLAQTGFHLLVL